LSSSKDFQSLQSSIGFAVCLGVF